MTRREGNTGCEEQVVVLCSGILSVEILEDFEHQGINSRTQGINSVINEKVMAAEHEGKKHEIVKLDESIIKLRIENWTECVFMARLTTLLSANGDPKPGNQRGTSAPDPSVFLHVFLDLYFSPVLVHVRLTCVCVIRPALF